MEPSSEARPGALEELLAAIDDAQQALVAWDITAFDAAVCRQRAICSRLPQPAPDDEAARRLRHAMELYRRLLQHSSQWARTMQAILHAGGHNANRRSTVHFRG